MQLGFDFGPGKFIRGLTIVSVIFLVMSLVVSFWGLFGQPDNWWWLTHNFDFDEKNNLPHAYKSLLLVLCGLAIFLNARLQSRTGGTFVKRWWVLGWIFLALAVDEEVQIHQKTVSLFFAQLSHADVDAKDSDGRVFWVIPYLIFTAGFCVAYLGFWWKLPSRVRTQFAVAGVVYVGGAAIVEEIAHHYAKHYGDANVPYLLLTNFSEWMQMIGSILFLRALLLHLTAQERVKVEMTDQLAG